MSTATCPTCKAPCTAHVEPRGGDGQGWGTTDKERTHFRYDARASAPPAQAPTAQAAPLNMSEVRQIGREALNATPTPPETAAQAVPSDAQIDAWSMDRHGFPNQLWFTRQEVKALIAALATVQPAQPKAATKERTPQDYAIEHAEYMATTSEHLIEAVNDLAMAEQERDEGTANPSDVEAAQDTLRECLGTMRNRIYEFRKRRDRAALAGQPAAQQAAVPTNLAGFERCPHGVDTAVRCESCETELAQNTPERKTFNAWWHSSKVPGGLTRDDWSGSSGEEVAWDAWESRAALAGAAQGSPAAQQGSTDTGSTP